MTEAPRITQTAVGESPLGTTAKSSLHTGSEEGQRKAHRALKYQALSQGRYWLVSQAKAEKPQEKPGDVYRTADCRHVNHGQIGVNVSPVHKAAHYSGLVTCGSVWACRCVHHAFRSAAGQKFNRPLTGPKAMATWSSWSRSPSRTSLGRAWAICWRARLTHSRGSARAGHGTR